MSPQAFLPAGLGTEDLASALAGLAAALVVAAVWRALLPDPAELRVRRVVARRDRLHAPRAERAGLGRQFWRTLGSWSKLRSAMDEKLRERLEAAGLRGRDAATAWLGAKLALPFLAGGGILASTLALAPDMEGTTRLLVALAGTLGGFYAPDLYVANLAARRRQALQRGVPDALDLMVICAEAGSSLDAAINRVARELGGSYPELGEELGITAMELGFLPDRRAVLENFARRTGLPAIRSVVATLMQAEKYGTPLGQSLRVLSSEYRNERMLKAEEKAARLPATLTVPLVCFIMPALFVVLIGPAIISAMESLRHF
ncbi:type II secretion system F family protein [Arenibaculum sp.]|jgi:tight adherence protein C|uniref:type II secretion system F family protein n=1 Tax=Arenibaculum sp. TaxID=2865862 RepID=UPI002E143D60|nr:type II secretion system F family protein [Arenibaculum sp.]